MPEPVEQGDLCSGGCRILEDGCFAHLHAGQFPLRDSHLFEIEVFGPRLRVPFDLQIVAELIEFLAVLARQHDGAGAKSVTEGVHADSGLSLGSLGASRLLRVTSISLELFECGHIVILTNKAKLGAGPREFDVS